MKELGRVSLAPNCVNLHLPSRIGRKITWLTESVARAVAGSHLIYHNGVRVQSGMLGVLRCHAGAGHAASMDFEATECARSRASRLEGWNFYGGGGR